MKHSLIKGFSYLFSLSLIAMVAAVVAPSMASADVSCTSANTVMYVVAHEDDSLLFQNPDVLHDIVAGKCVNTVFVTAGDSGLGQSYWMGRENGAKASYAFMASTTNVWTQSDAGVPGHSVIKFTLNANPNVSLVFFRLPDGNIDGSGYASTSYQGLQKLWQNDISSITTVDGATTYSRAGLIDALAALMNVVNPSRINTQDFTGTFGDGDHSDHHAVGYFVQSAHLQYATLHTLFSYDDYNSWKQPANVVGDDFTANQNAYLAYAPFDGHVCQNFISCTGSYLVWLARLYTTGFVQGGDVCTNLAGVQTTVPEGYVAQGNQCVPSGEVSCDQNITSGDVVSDTSNTVSTGGYAVETFVPYSWTANIPGATWIWNAFHVSDPFNGETVAFTKEFVVTGTPTSASIVIASDDNYEASINGTQFASVADFDNFTSGKEDTFDVTALLHNGTNTLVVTGHNIPMGVSDPELNTAGVRYKLSYSQNACVPTPPPVCPEGTTGTYPECTPIVVITDVCPNIEGAQSVVPEGYQTVDGQCVAITPSNNGGSGGGSGSAYTYGCTDPLATNYNGLANASDNSCVYSGSSSSTSTSSSSSTSTSVTIGGGTTQGEVLGAATGTPELPLPQGCSAYITTYMKYGRKNNIEDVKRLQTFLNETMNSNLPVTGYFGLMTKSWVRKLQVKYHAEIIQPWINAGFTGKDVENGSGFVYITTQRFINITKCDQLKDAPMPELVPFVAQ